MDNETKIVSLLSAMEKKFQIVKTVSLNHTKSNVEFGVARAVSEQSEQNLKTQQVHFCQKQRVSICALFRISQLFDQLDGSRHKDDKFCKKVQRVWYCWQAVTIGNTRKIAFIHQRKQDRIMRPSQFIIKIIFFTKFAQSYLTGTVQLFSYFVR